MDLIEKLRAAIDEDERIALSVTPGPWEAELLWHYTTTPPFSTWDVGRNIKFSPDPHHDYEDQEIAAYGTRVECDDSRSEANASHIARHDPARVLAMVAAHREILELHPHRRFQEPLNADSQFEEDRRPPFEEDPRYVGCERCNWDHRYEEVYPSWWCDHVLALARAYGIEVE